MISATPRKPDGCAGSHESTFFLPDNEEPRLLHFYLLPKETLFSPRIKLGTFCVLLLTQDNLVSVRERVASQILLCCVGHTHALFLSLTHSLSHSAAEFGLTLFPAPKQGNPRCIVVRKSPRTTFTSLLRFVVVVVVVS